MPKSIVWLGSVFDENTLKQQENISPAGNKWQKNIIDSIINNNYEIHCFGHLAERIYPYGKLFISKKTGKKLFNNIGISYVNLPFIRNIMINFSILIKFISHLKSHSKPECVISYNIYDYNCVTALIIKKIYKIPWVILVADPKNDKTDEIHYFAKHADKFVFLSWILYKNSFYKHKLHLDGGINEIKQISTSNQLESFILYSGKLAKHTGLHLLIDAYNEIIDPNFKLYISGNGNSKYLDNAVKFNLNIINKGFLTETELIHYSSNALILINPRLISHETNFSNFPSKILEYLSFCRPIISTKTPGISHDYESVINFIYSDNKEELKDKILEIISWSEEKRFENSQMIAEFNTFKRWDYQAKKLIKFINGV